MDSIGVELKNARMRKGLSLEEVSGITRIPVRLLLGIESDDFGSMDSAFRYRSFARQFAQCVGLDGSSELDESLDAAARHIPEPLVPGQGSTRGRPHVPGMRPKKTHKFRWMLSVASLGIMLGACSTFYQFWESSRGAPDPRNSNISSKQPRPGDAGVTRDQSRLSAPGLPPEALRIKLSALENTWLSLTADGQEVFKGTLRADDSKTLEGRQTAQVRTENAGGVEIVFNGRPLGKLGSEGEMRTVIFTKDSYNVVHEPPSMPLASLIRGVE